MGGTQRTAKFVKYLPDFGWEPIVLSVKDVAYFAKDESLLQDVVKAKVIRTGSLDPQRLLAIFRLRKVAVNSKTKQSGARRWGALSRLLAWFLVPDAKILWIPFVIGRALLAIKRGNVDCLFTTGPPHSVHLAGIILKKLTHLPLVIDFRDGWAEGNFQNEPTKLHKRLNRYLEKLVLEKADGVVAVSNRLTDALKGKIAGQADRFYTVTNGYDKNDFGQSLPRAERAKAFRVTYCGTVSAIAPVDAFLRALSELLDKRPELKPELQVQFVGLDLDGHLADRIRDLHLEEVSRIYGYLEHQEAVNILANSDLLLYTVANWASEDFVPGKTFEYIASGVPILAVGPRVEGIRILEEYAEVKVVDQDDLESIQGCVSKYYELSGTAPRREINPGYATNFERRNLTERLAGVLEVVAKQSFNQPRN